jgi:putative ABC transport system permease protein
VVNETFARTFLSGANPVGSVIRSDQEPGYPEAQYEIVGLFRDTKYADLRENIPPIAFAAQSQHPNDGPWLRFVIRAGASLPNVTTALRKTLEKTSPGISLVETRLLRAQVEDGLIRERLMAYLAGFFAALATALAAIGLFGVVSYMTARRRAEIGIRLALGATRAGIIHLIVRNMVVALAVGLAAGTIGALLAAKSAATLLFGLSAYDAPTIAISAAILGGVVLLASWLPALRASGLNPMTTLREE